MVIENGVMDVVQPDLNYNGGFHARLSRGPHGAKEEYVDLPAQHADRRGIGEHSAIRGVDAQYRALYGVCASRREEVEPWYAPNFEIRNGVIPLPAGTGDGAGRSIRRS